MSRHSTNLVRRAKRLRDRRGEDILFNGETLRGLYRESVSNKTGTYALPQAQYGPMIAAFTPVEIELSPQDFEPYTSRTVPVEGTYLQRMGTWIRITRLDFENEDGDTISVKVFGYKDINYTPPDGTNTSGANNMGLTFTTNRSATYGGVTTGGSAALENVASAVPMSVDIPANQTDYLIDFSDITIAKVLHISIDTTADCTIKTNNSTTPGQTITLVPATPLFWTTGDVASNPISTSTLTALYVTTTAKATLKMLVAVSRT